MNLSALEQWLVDALLRRVRILALIQIETFWRARSFSQTPAQAIRKLKRLGLVESFRYDSIVLELQSPLLIWKAGDEAPHDFSKIAWRAKSRFLRSNPREHQILLATDTAQNLLGGVGGSLRQPNQIMHDLGTSSVYVAKQCEEPDCTSNWIGEDVIRRSWRHLNIRKVPDAAVIEDEQVINVIEFAGRDYGKSYLEKFHLFWQRRTTPYEIW